MKKYIQHIILSIVALLSATTFCSCLSDEPHNAVKVSMSISSLPAPAGDHTDPATDAEKIHSWWMAFVSQDGIVSEIVSRDPALTSAVEDEVITAQIRPGEYMVYAFANITPQQLYEATGVSFKIGENVPSAVSEAVWSNLPVNFTALYGNNAPIPMSGYRNVSVTTNSNSSFSIEVIRMFAKMEFLFKNDSDADIEVLGVSIGPMYSGDAPLFAKSTLPNTPPMILPTAVADSLTHVFPTSDTRLLPGGATSTYNPYIYLRESSALNHPTQHFHIGVRIRRSDLPEETIYALTSDISHINRNDWIHIPITFTDWSLECLVSFYPPIGGYPAVMVEEKNHEYYVTFKSGGDFVIIPRVKSGKTNQYIGIDKTSISCTVESDPNNILARTPQFNNVTYELVGALRDGTQNTVVQGTAIINLDIKVKEDTNSTHIFRRKIYIKKI